MSDTLIEHCMNVLVEIILEGMDHQIGVKNKVIRFILPMEQILTFLDVILDAFVVKVTA